MTRQRDLVPAVPVRRRAVRGLCLGLALLAVLAAGFTRHGVSAVTWLRAFLEFFSGVFVLVGLTAAVTAGLVASWRLTPIRLRVLAQSGHRALAVMSMSFLAAHILLKTMERHASVLDVVVPFCAMHGRAIWIGLGTVASDMMIIIFATGLARGRFIVSRHAWTWRALHIAAYLCWPIAIVHGLKAGPPKDWVTLSYVVCAGLVAVVAFARLVSSARRHGATRRRDPPVTERPAEQPSPGTQDVPDERFWTELKAEAAQWTRSKP